MSPWLEDESNRNSEDIFFSFHDNLVLLVKVKSELDVLGNVWLRRRHYCQPLQAMPVCLLGQQHRRRRRR